MNVGGSCNACAAQVQSAQGLAVLRKAMDAQKLEGLAALRLIQAAPVPPPPPGTGTVVDVQA